MVDAPIKVLLIDDHRPFYTLTRALLHTSRLRAQIEWIGTFDKGLAEVALNRHDIYLVDYQLGDGTGTDIVRHARTHGNNAPMIVLTGRTDEEIDLEALSAGATDYISKGRLDGRLLERTIRYSLERKRMIDALKESNQRYRHIVETSQEGIVVVDSSGRITFVNARMAALLGTPADELFGRPLSDFADDRERHLLASKLQQPAAAAEQFDFRFTCHDGSTIWAIICSNPIQDSSGSYVGTLAMVTDITARHQAEEALKEAHDLLEHRVNERTAELSEALEALEASHYTQRQFFVDASHDLRTPLTVIRAELDLLRCHEELTGSISDSLTTIAAQVRRLDLLAGDLLLLARLESGSADDERRAIRLDELLMECIESLAPMAREKEILWEVRIDDAVEIYCHPQAVERAIFNILENAIKYSQAGATICVVLRSLPTEVSIVISDNGPGMDESDVPRVFERFYRGGMQRHTTGTGLGLSIVKAIVEAHDGTVSLRSYPAAGTRVEVRLPKRIEK